jgi:outer membrane lipoprotein-sorting protein
MKILRHFQIVVSGVFLCIYNLNAQTTDPREILNKVQAQYEAIEDYQVSVHLNVDIQNFRMPNKNMRVYFKKPDKLKVKTSGFAIVPRFGLFRPRRRF